MSSRVRRLVIGIFQGELGGQEAGQHAAEEHQQRNERVAQLAAPHVAPGKVGQPREDQAHDKQHEALKGHGGDEEHQAQPQHQQPQGQQNEGHFQRRAAKSVNDLEPGNEAEDEHEGQAAEEDLGVGAALAQSRQIF